MNTFYQNHETLPVIDEYDVIVTGGGMAGISAAVAASRLGVKVLLLERHIGLGGLATSGLIAYFLPICDGEGTIVSTGICQELYELAVQDSDKEGPFNKRSRSFGNEEGRYEVQFYPMNYQLSLSQYLHDNSVDRLYGVIASTPVIEEGTCVGLIVEQSEGRICYAATSYIDASGECSLFSRTGVETVAGSNTMSSWYYTSSSANPYELHSIGADAPTSFDLVERGNVKAYCGATSTDLTEFILDSENLIRNNENNTENQYRNIAILPSIAQLRTIRRIKGTSELTEDSINSPCNSSIGCVSDWMTCGKIFEVPAGILYSEQISNIIAAGRCVSATGYAYEILRCIPQACMTGQAAGTIAGLMVNNDMKSISDLSIVVLQDQLVRDGVKLHYL